MAQTINRLTPLSDVRALIAAEAKPVAPSEIEIAGAAGCVLAEDVIAPARPSGAIALQDGWALASDDTLGAGGYTPMPLTRMPSRVEAGEPMPPGSDCVAPFDAVRMRNGQAEALAALAPGEGVLPAGGDHDGSAALCHSGARLTQTQIAALAALGVAHVRVRRPRIVVAPARSDAILHSAADFVRGDLQRRGAAVESAASLDAAVAHDADTIVVIGGTGSGENDASASTLAARGRLLVHGIALSPGETAGFGIVGTRPVLLLPGRLDAAIAVWLMLGRALLDALAGAKAEQSGETLTLARKITSTLGITELIPVRRNGGKAEPLAARYWPLSAIARADGIIVISPESEGASAGAAVQVWPFA